MSREEQFQDGDAENPGEDAFPPEWDDLHLLPFEAAIVSGERSETLVRIDRWNLIACGWFDKRGKLHPIFKLSGVVTGHPSLADGTQVKTNEIIACTGRFVRTASGRRYILSVNPEPQYLEAREHFDPQNPLRGISFEF